MKKSELIKEVAKRSGLSQKDVSKVIESAIEVIQEALKKDEKVSIIGFGTFERVKRAPRKTKIPKTDKEVFIPEGYSVRFRVGKKLKEAVNS